MVMVSKTQMFVIVSFLLLGVSFETPRVAAETPQSKAKKKIKIKWGKPVEGIVGAVVLEQTSIEHRIDRPILINLHLKNTGTKDVSFSSNGILWSYKLHVIGPDGKAVPFTFNGKKNTDILHRSGQRGPDILKSKSALQFNFVYLNNYYDMTLPGTYKVFFNDMWVHFVKNKPTLIPSANGILSISNYVDTGEFVTVTSNRLKIKVIGLSKQSQESKPEKSKIKWGKPIEKISCAISTNVKKTSYWVNLHTKTPAKLKGLVGEYEISVLAPYREAKPHILKRSKITKGKRVQLLPLILPHIEYTGYMKKKWHPMPLTSYGLQQTKGKSKSTLHITLKPNEKEDFVRICLNRYFDMTLNSDDGYKVSFKRKFKLPKKKKTVTIQSNTLQIGGS